MPSLAEAVRRILVRPGRLRRQRNGEAHFRVARSEDDVARSAALFAHCGRRSQAQVRQHLVELWDQGSTTLYVQFDNMPRSADLFVSRHKGPAIVASGQSFRAETVTEEPAPDGSYLVERQYRRLGFYETPPADRVVVALRVAAGPGKVYLVNVPPHVTHVTAVANDELLVAAAAMPRGRHFRLDGRLPDHVRHQLPQARTG